MKKNKPRHNPLKLQNLYGISKCAYDDGTEWKECGYEWANRCKGNLHMCRKLYYQFLASLSDKKREEYIEKSGDRIKTPHTNLILFE